MNPLRSMDQLVRYTVCLHCFYVYSLGIHAGPGHTVPRCVCVFKCADLVKKWGADISIYSTRIVLDFNPIMWWH